VIDYKNSNVADELKTKAKNGIDLFFDKTHVPEILGLK